MMKIKKLPRNFEYQVWQIIKKVRVLDTAGGFYEEECVGIPKLIRYMIRKSNKEYH